MEILATVHRASLLAPLILGLCSCATHKKRDKDFFELRREAVTRALDDLERRLGGQDLYAGVAATQFENGAPLKVLEQETFYQLKGASKGWRQRLHVVTIRLVLGWKKKTDRVSIQYTFKEKNSKDTKMVRQFIYGFPATSYLHLQDPLSAYRRQSRFLRHLKRREVVVGMSEEMLFFAWGRPQVTDEVTSLLGVEKTHTYGSYRIYIRRGKIVRKERQRARSDGR